MKTLSIIGWITAALSIACWLGMYWGFNNGAFSFGFVNIYGFLSFFMISVVSFRIKKRMEIHELETGK